LAQPKPEAKNRPALTFAEPFAVDAGKPVKITVRGLRLDNVAEVRCHEPKATARLIGKPVKIGVPDIKLLASHGDMKVEVELTLPPDTARREVTISLVNPAGESPPLRLLVNDDLPRAYEKEPNNGFRQAQSVPLGQVIDGAIQQPLDVDVFVVEGKAGERVAFTAHAGRFGSPLEPLLTLYDERGETLMTSEDVGREQDARLELTLPRSGRYYLSVNDAHEQGGKSYRYRLRVEKVK
jgi:hypothetical protein